MSGALGIEPTWLNFTACAADVLRDRRIVGRDLFIRWSSGAWWVQEDFDPDATASDD